MSDGTKKVLAVLAFILAILSIAFCWITALSVVLGAVAVIFAVMVIRSKKSLGIASLILAVIGIIFAAAVWRLVSAALGF